MRRQVRLAPTLRGGPAATAHAGCPMLYVTLPCCVHAACSGAIPKRKAIMGEVYDIFADPKKGQDAARLKSFIEVIVGRRGCACPLPLCGMTWQLLSRTLPPGCWLPK